MHAIITLEGRLVNAPEYRMGKEDREYCTFRMAVNQRYGGQDTASFFNCTGNSSIASRLKKAGIEKGRLLSIVGNLTLRDYEDNSGQRRMSADVGILDWHFVDGRKPDEKSGTSTSGEEKPAKGKIYGETYIPSGDEDELPI